MMRLCFSPLHMTRTLPMMLAMLLSAAPLSSGGVASRLPLFRSVLKTVEASRVVAAGGMSSEGDDFGVWRAIGVEDFQGTGSGWQSCGPFLLVEEEVASLEGRIVSGGRPLAGLCAVTIPFSGPAVMPCTNIEGSCGAVLEPGGLLVVNSGSGVVLSEERHTSPTHQDVETRSQICRVWIDAGCGAGQHPLASPQVLTRHLLCVYTAGPGHTIRVLLGDYDGISSPCNTWRARVLLLEGYVEAGAPEDAVELPRAMSNAFVYIPQSGGRGTFGQGRVEVSERMAADVSGQGARLTIKNTGPLPLHYILGAGMPFEPDMKKLLVYADGGGFACSTQEIGKEIRMLYEEDVQGFGKVHRM